MRQVEFLVVGLGAMGSAALYHLARRGAAPHGLEQYEVNHSFGSSHGHSRVFRTFYHDPIYVKMAEAALPLWRELETGAGKQLLRLTGTLFFAGSVNQSMEQNLRVIRTLNRTHELLTAREVTERFPVLHLPTDRVAFFMPEGGFVDASGAVGAHLSQAQRVGAKIHEKTRVLKVDLTREQPEVETSAGRYRCDKLIITPGPWASQILKSLSLPLQVTRQQKFYFRPGNSADYRPDRLPVYADLDMMYYGFPYYGPGIKVADDIDGDVTSPESIDRTIDRDSQGKLQSWLEMIMPAGNFSFVSGAICMYTVTPDRDFLIGLHPQNSNIIVGAGFSGHGFKFSTLVGQILAELAIDKATSFPVEKFGLNRFN